MGWIWLAVIGGAAFMVLRVAGLPRATGWFAAAALLLGATGYAWQQHAAMPGHPVAAAAQGVDVDPELTEFRATIMPASDATHRTLASADDDLRRGDTTAAARSLTDAVARSPRDAALWAGLGSALAAHDGQQLSPAALFAFRRAWQLDPKSPGPPFFLGLAYIQAGDFPAAKTAWLRTLVLAPRDAPYRVAIAERLVMIDEFQAMAARAKP